MPRTSAPTPPRNPAAAGCISLPLGLPHAPMTLTCHAPGSVMPRHRHATPYVSVLLRGGYREELAHGHEHVAPGQLIVHPADEWHTDRFGAHGAVCLNLTEETLNHRLLGGIAWPSLGKRTTRTGLSLATTAVALASSHTATATARAVLEALAHDLRPLGHSRTDTEPLPAWFVALEHAIENRFREPLSVAALCHAVGCSREHAARTYARVRGRTMTARIRELRLQWVELQLASSSATLSALAADAGFSDHSHLTRSMRRARGAPPSTWRREQTVMP